MNNYTELIETLRWCADNKKRCTTDVNCRYLGKGFLCMDSLMLDAAAAIEELQQKWFKSETDATNLTGKLAQAEADIERLNLEIDKRIATEIELSKSLDAANHQLKMHSMCPFDDEED